MGAAQRVISAIAALTQPAATGELSPQQATGVCSPSGRVEIAVPGTGQRRSRSGGGLSAAAAVGVEDLVIWHIGRRFDLRGEIARFGGPGVRRAGVQRSRSRRSPTRCLGEETARVAVAAIRFRCHQCCLSLSRQEIATGRGQTNRSVGWRRNAGTTSIPGWSGEHGDGRRRASAVLSRIKDAASPACCLVISTG